MRDFRIALLIAAFAAPPFAFDTVLARDLTPEVRRMIFSAPREVDLAGHEVTIPLDGTDDRGFYKCPYMQVYVNGRGPFTFLLDSGSSYSMVSTKVVVGAHLPVVFDRSGKRDVVRLRDVRISGVTVHDLWAIHDDDFGVDGVFGFQAFAGRTLIFKLAARQLVIADEAVSLPNSFNLPYEISNFTPTIPLRVGDRTVPTLIDTGDDANAWEARASDLAGVTYTHKPVPAEPVLNGADVQVATVTTVADPVSLGPLIAEHAVVAINDALPVPDIGYGVLRQFNVMFDPERLRVSFQPLEGDFHIPGNLSIGFYPAFDAHAHVGGVIPESEAEKSGMQKGDILLSVNGLEATRYAPRMWDALLALRKPLSVRWQHNSAVHEGKFEVYELR